MANMSYCRFRNTLAALRDCQDHLDDSDNLSAEETKARRHLILCAMWIADDYRDEVTSNSPQKDAQGAR